MNAAVRILHNRIIHLLGDRMRIIDVTVTVTVAIADAIVAAITTITISPIANVLLMMMMIIICGAIAVVAANFRRHRLIANARCICAAIWKMSLGIMNDVIM